MKGLLLKDLLFFRTQGKINLLAMALVIVFSVVQESPGILAAAVVLFVWIFLMNSFSQDELNKWPTFVITTSLNKREWALSKYLFVGSLYGIGFLIFLPFLLGWFGFHLQIPVKTLFLFMGGFILAGWILCTIFIPVFFKWGPEKGRICIMVFILSCYPLLFLAGKYKPQLEPLIESIQKYGITIAILIAILSTIVSIFISTRIVYKKEY